MNGCPVAGRPVLGEGDGPGGKAEIGKAESENNQLTDAERAAVQRFLEGGAAPGTSARGRMITWALKIAATFLLATGVGMAVGDGNEFDGADCGVAAKPLSGGFQASKCRCS